MELDQSFNHSMWPEHHTQLIQAIICMHLQHLIFHQEKPFLCKIVVSVKGYAFSFSILFIYYSVCCKSTRDSSLGMLYTRGPCHLFHKMRQGLAPKPNLDYFYVEHVQTGQKLGCLCGNFSNLQLHHSTPTLVGQRIPGQKEGQ